MYKKIYIYLSIYVKEKKKETKSHTSFCKKEAYNKLKTIEAF